MLKKGEPTAMELEVSEPRRVLWVGCPALMRDLTENKLFGYYKLIIFVLGCSD